MREIERGEGQKKKKKKRTGGRGRCQLFLPSPPLPPPALRGASGAVAAVVVVRGAGPFAGRGAEICRGSTSGASATRLGSGTWSGSLRATGKSSRWTSRTGEARPGLGRPGEISPCLLSAAAWSATRMRSLFPALSLSCVFPRALPPLPPPALRWAWKWLGSGARGSQRLSAPPWAAGRERVLSLLCRTCWGPSLPGGGLQVNSPPLSSPCKHFLHGAFATLLN